MMHHTTLIGHRGRRALPCRTGPVRALSRARNN